MPRYLPSPGFNGATTFQPWKPPSTRTEGSPRWSFNGATTFQPWKPVHTGRPHTIVRSFNGATTFQPWKLSGLASVEEQTLPLQWGHDLSAVETRGTGRGHGRGDQASMGPRPFSRGNDPFALDDYTLVERFNGATTFQPWKLGVDQEISGGVWVWSSASMGPRPFSRGNVSVPILGDLEPGASMGPRPFSRGNYVTPYPCPKCGDGFNGATTFQPWKPKVWVSVVWTWTCFNGATTFQPWKLRSCRCSHCSMSKLQWGHDLSAVETRCPEMDAIEDGDASMGPRPFSRGNPITSSETSLSGWSLQWGHDLSAVETRCLCD